MSESKSGGENTPFYLFNREGVSWSPQKGLVETLKNISKRRKKYQADIKRRMDQVEGISYNLMVLKRDSDSKTRIDICNKEYGAVKEDPIYKAIVIADRINELEGIARREDVWFDVSEQLIKWQNGFINRSMNYQEYILLGDKTPRQILGYAISKAKEKCKEQSRVI